MVNIRPTQLILAVAAASSLLALYACGGGGTSSTSTPSNAYQGAGSAWTIDSNKGNGACKLTESDSDLKIVAKCAELDSGFTQITVDSVTGGNASAAKKGDVTHAFEIAGYMMPFIAFGEGKVVPTVTAGSCVSSLNHNYVMSFAKLKDSSATFATWPNMGNYTIDNTGLTVNGYLASGVQVYNNAKTPNYTLSSCADGIMKDTTNGAKSSFYLTKNGGAIFHQDRTNFAPVPATPPLLATVGSTENDFMLPATNDVTSLAGLDGKYIGFAVASQGTGNYTTTPVSVTATNGVFALSSRSGADLTTVTPNHSSFTLNATKVATSLYKGTLTHTNVGAIGCAINANIGSQKIVICSGVDPADTSFKTLYSVILKSI